MGFVFDQIILYQLPTLLQDSLEDIVSFFSALYTFVLLVTFTSVLFMTIVSFLMILPTPRGVWIRGVALVSTVVIGIMIIVMFWDTITHSTFYAQATPPQPPPPSLHATVDV